MSESLIPAQDRDWICRYDDHAAARLRLLDDAEKFLGGGDLSPTAELNHLVERIERWRCQWLHERWGADAGATPSATRAGDRRLADSLDHLARRLRRRSPMPPRWPRGAVQDATLEPPEVRLAAAALDPNRNLEEVCSEAREVTARVFGGGDAPAWPVRLYAPIYLSSHCANRCVYCGFAANLTVPRRHLDLSQAAQQAAHLQRRGFRHLLLVAGDFPRLTTPAYLEEVIRQVAGQGAEPAVEIAAQTTLDYAALAAAGAQGVTLYMETYNELAYVRSHPRGPKVSFDWRLEALDRAAEAGIRRLGLGMLVGLAEPVADLLALVRHAIYLRRRFTSIQLSFSLPRIHEAPEAFNVPHPVADDFFVRMYAALRLALPDVGLVLSTREPPELRQRLAGICITQMSAASSTVPGGYEDTATDSGAGGQFPVADNRSVEATVAWLRSGGHPVIWSLDEGLPRSAPVKEAM